MGNRKKEVAAWPIYNVINYSLKSSIITMIATATSFSYSQYGGQNEVPVDYLRGISASISAYAIKKPKIKSH